jgi:hypothetical protein
VCRLNGIQVLRGICSLRSVMISCLSQESQKAHRLVDVIGESIHDKIKPSTDKVKRKHESSTSSSASFFDTTMTSPPNHLAPPMQTTTTARNQNKTQSQNHVPNRTAHPANSPLIIPPFQLPSPSHHRSSRRGSRGRRSGAGSSSLVCRSPRVASHGMRIREGDQRRNL